MQKRELTTPTFKVEGPRKTYCTKVVIAAHAIA